MDELIRTKLAALPPLGSGPAPHRTCKICGATAPAFDVVDFQKMCSTDNPYMFGHAGVPVYYYRCIDCEFLFTDFTDGWSSEDFSRFIYNEAYIKVDGDYVEARPRRDAQFFLELLAPYPGLSVLDYGGGAGVLAAVLREHGFQAECYDPFSSPARPEGKFELITCMEVLEHSPDPVGTLRDMASFLRPGGCILVGTGVQPDDIASVRCNWWYVGPRNGHISLQSPGSLIPLARQAGLVAHPSNYLHGFAGMSPPSATSAALLARIGPPTVELVLHAPDATGAAGAATADPANWHGIEDETFRWTAKDQVRWQWTPPFAHGRVRLRLPWVLEIAPEFTRGSYLTIGEQRVAVEFDGRDPRATVTIDSDAPLTIRLHTPPLPRALDLYGGADDRHLGIALRLHGAAPAA